jgi:hypothetical protein
MGEATRDNQSSTSEPEKDRRKRQGWIRIHTDEAKRTPSVEEQEDNLDKSRDQKPRKLEKPID